MKRSTKLWVLALITALGAQAAPARAEGTRGGGNTLNGRPIETYMGDFTALPIYKGEVEPFLEKLAPKIPVLAEDMKRILQKTWYFVPVPLSALPADVTGIPFASNQTILQTGHEVWVDQNGLNAMTPSDQRLLLIHELLMSAYLSQHRKAPLGAEDTGIVRSVTAYFARNPDAPASDIADALEKYGFPRYHEAISSVAKLDRLLRKESLPTFHSSSETGGVETGRVSCHYGFKYDESTQSLAFSVKYDTFDGFGSISGKDPHPAKMRLLLPPTQLIFEDYEHDKHLYYLFVDGDAPAADRELRTVLSLDITKGIIVSLQTSVMRCRDPERSGTCNWESLSGAELRQAKKPNLDHVCGQND